MYEKIPIGSKSVTDKRMLIPNKTEVSIVWKSRQRFESAPLIFVYGRLTVLSHIDIIAFEHWNKPSRKIIFDWLLHSSKSVSNVR